jgi:hypothetical protein
LGPRKRRAILLHLSLRFFEALLRCREALAQRLALLGLADVNADHRLAPIP